MCIHGLDIARSHMYAQAMTMNAAVHAQRAIAGLAIVGTLGFGAWAGMAAASADPVNTINLTEVDDIDVLPVCAEEDCSDQPGQTGLWLDRDTGNWYLERGESYTRLIVDDTASGLAYGPNAWDEGAYVGGYS